MNQIDREKVVSKEIENIIWAVADVLAENDLQDHCIHSAALLSRALNAKGYAGSYLLTVGVKVLNPAYVAWIDAHGVPKSDDAQRECANAGGVVIHLGAGRDQALHVGDWKGHLVVIAPKSFEGKDCMFDISVPQLNRHAADLNLMPVVARLDPDSGFSAGKDSMMQKNNGCIVRYTAYPDDESFNDGRDVMSLNVIEEALADVLARLK